MLNGFPGLTGSPEAKYNELSYQCNGYYDNGPFARSYFEGVQEEEFEARMRRILHY